MTENTGHAALIAHSKELANRWGSSPVVQAEGCDVEEALTDLIEALTRSEHDLAKAWRDGSDAGFEYGYVKGSTDPDFVDDSDAPVNPFVSATP